MKKNKMMRIASVLLVAVLLSTCAISGTFAKFITTEEVTDNARVAIWDIDFDGDDNATKEFAFDLFNTVNDLAGGDTGDDLDVKNATDDMAIIAPGTTGTFDIVLTNNSEVNAKYKIEFAPTLNGVPLTFTYKIGSTDYTPGEFVNIAMGATATVTVTWSWAFTDTVENDLQNKTLSVKATATVEQVD